jgi:drug/metabolite transporter (DMT)-like permease
MSFDASKPPAAGLTAIVLTVGTATGFALMNGITKFLTQAYPVSQVVWARFFFAFVAIVLASLRDPGLRRLVKTNRPGMQALRSVLMVASTTAFILALALMPLADVEAINFAAPLFVASLSAPLLGERVPASVWAAVVVGLIGVLFIVRPGLGVLSWAALLPILVAFMYACFQILTRIIGNTDPASTSMFYSVLLGTAATSLAMPWVWVWPTAVDWALMVAAGCLGAGSHFLLVKALQLAPASLLQPFTYVQLIAAVIIGYVVFDALPDLFTWIGSLIVVASGLFVLWRQRQGKV